MTLKLYMHFIITSECPATQGMEEELKTKIDEEILKKQNIYMLCAD